MRYTTFGETGEKVSRLSLGCMRFPDEETAIEIVEKAVELGINYYETGSRYCGGQSEVWLGKGLGTRRKDVMVSTKARVGGRGPGFPTADDARRMIGESLGRLGTDHLDFYHAWSVNYPEEYDELKKKGMWLEGVVRAKEEGLVRHVGVTSHATPALLMQMLDEGLFEPYTVQYSLLLQPHRDVIRKAREKGRGVVLMGPLAGGLLAKHTPVLAQAFAPDSQVLGAFKYVLCDPGVSTAASGMRSVEEVEANCALIDSLPEELDFGYQTAVGERLRAELGDGLEEFERYLCGDCRYCTTVCPEGIVPGSVFKPYNAVMLKVDIGNTQRLIERADAMLSRCTRCGKCQEICPQGINVPDHLERVKDTFAAMASESAQR